MEGRDRQKGRNLRKDGMEVMKEMECRKEAKGLGRGKGNEGRVRRKNGREGMEKTF